jgi:hypothetical protein
VCDCDGATSTKQGGRSRAVGGKPGFAIVALIDGRRPAERGHPKETTMSRIEELKVEQTDDVIGGVKTATSASTASVQTSTDDSNQYVAASGHKQVDSYAETKRYD